MLLIVICPPCVPFIVSIQKKSCAFAPRLGEKCASVALWVRPLGGLCYISGGMLYLWMLTNGCLWKTRMQLLGAKVEDATALGICREISGDFFFFFSGLLCSDSPRMMLACLVSTDLIFGDELMKKQQGSA